MEDYKIEIFEFLNQVEACAIKYIKKQGERFGNSTKLIRRYEINKSQWFDVFGKSEGNEKDYNEELDRIIREIYETVNEVLIAREILLDRKCIELKYEHKLENTEKTIDFYVNFEESKPIYCDVKTLHSIKKTKKEQEKDWEKYSKLYGKRIIDGLKLFEDGLGGMFFHNYLSSRSKMLSYICELEKKINYIGKEKDYKFVMLYCGNGFDYHEDLLEDFADFYIQGKHRDDDFFSKLEKHFIKNKNVELLRNVDEIWYFERKFYDLKPKKFVKGIKGP